MKQKSDNHELLLRYLLGELTEEEQSRLERRYFTEDDLFEEMLLVEDDLIESYARGELSERERERIEKHFLMSDERREKLTLARALIRIANGQPSPSQPGGVEHKRVSWWRGLMSYFRFAL